VVVPADAAFEWTPGTSAGRVSRFAGDVWEVARHGLKGTRQRRRQVGRIGSSAGSIRLKETVGFTTTAPFESASRNPRFYAERLSLCFPPTAEKPGFTLAAVVTLDVGHRAEHGDLQPW